MNNWLHETIMAQHVFIHSFISLAHVCIVYTEHLGNFYVSKYENQAAFASQQILYYLAIILYTACANQSTCFNVCAHEMLFSTDIFFFKCEKNAFKTV